MSKGLDPLIGIPIVFVVLFVVQTIINKNIDYKCEKCGKEFSISTFTGMLTQHNMGRKLLTCPSCGERTWARPVRIHKS